MKSEKIIVKDLINRNNATSQGNAILLRDHIIKILSEKEEKSVIVDFSDINNYTILFFNFSLSYLICKCGLEWFDKFIHVEGLSELGQYFYTLSRINAIDKSSKEKDNNERI